MTGVYMSTVIISTRQKCFSSIAKYVFLFLHFVDFMDTLYTLKLLRLYVLLRELDRTRMLRVGVDCLHQLSQLGFVCVNIDSSICCIHGNK
jgi:hypothetical protein